MSSTYAQELASEIRHLSAKPLTSAKVREWSSAKPIRRPLTPQQEIKLRDVDILIIEDRCKGCSYCIKFCPRQVLELDEKLNKIGIHPPRIKDSTLCVGCGVCEDICPDFAIFLIDKGEPR